MLTVHTVIEGLSETSLNNKEKYKTNKSTSSSWQTYLCAAINSKVMPIFDTNWGWHSLNSTWNVVNTYSWSHLIEFSIHDFNPINLKQKKISHHCFEVDKKNLPVIIYITSNNKKKKRGRKMVTVW